MTFLARLLARSSGESAVVRPRPALSVLPFARVEDDVHSAAEAVGSSTTLDRMSQQSPPVPPPMPRTQPPPTEAAPRRRPTQLVASEETWPMRTERAPQPAHLEPKRPDGVEAAEAQAATPSHETPRSAQVRSPTLPAAAQGKTAARETKRQPDVRTPSNIAAAHTAASQSRPTPAPSSVPIRSRPAAKAEGTKREEPDTVVHIHIGRIEVRAEPEPARPGPVREAPAPRLTLEEYTRQRMRGER